MSKIHVAILGATGSFGQKILELLSYHSLFKIKELAASVGRLRVCSLFDYKFVVLLHNTVRGSAGGTTLIAKLLHAKGFPT